jgi:hypothetical protein
MFNLQLQLYIVSFNQETSEQCFISLEKDKYVPLFLEIKESIKSIQEILEQIFEEHIELGFGWTIPKLIDANKDQDTIRIVYTCSIPPGTTLKKCHRVSKNIANIDPLARKALCYV